MTVKELPSEEKELKVKVSNPTNLPTINYHKLSILQGDLKTLSKENKAKLCKSILTHGYFVPAFVWRSGEDMWILDATQRYQALEELEKQGYTIPEIPYIEIEAKDKKDATQKLLQITSRYGEINPNTSFLNDFDLNIDELDISIPELNLTIINEIDYEKEWEGMPEFENEDKTAFKKLIINFKNKEDMYGFSNIIKQPINEKTISLWHPKQKQDKVGDIEYKSNES